VEIGSDKYEVCGQVNVINLFRDQDKRRKNFGCMRADRKGNFARARACASRAKFHADPAIACICSRSHHARFQFFARRRNLVSLRTNAVELFSRSPKYFFDRTGSSGKSR
jgi:hypothetical protein